MLEDEELVNVNSPYFKKPGDYSLKIFDFYVCFMCDQPYNGGKHDCAGGVEVIIIFIIIIINIIISFLKPFFFSKNIN